MRGYEAHARVRERPAPRARSTSQSVAGERTMLTPKVLLILADRGVVLDPEAAAVARPPTARCLFGVPDTQEAVNFAEEQLREERERFLSRFGFDILAPYLSEDEDGHHCKARCGPLRRFPHSRQLLITDLWRARRRTTSPHGLKAPGHRVSDASTDTTPASTTKTPVPASSS